MRRGGDKSAGFTIVETLIVLAVSALVAVSAMLLIGGRQAKTQFMVASNDLRQQIEQVINETRSGYYPGSGDFSCLGSAGTQPTITSGPKAQGTNSGCVFLGKAVEFGLTQTGGADNEAYAIYPLVGNQQDNVTHQEVSSYIQAKAIALAPDKNDNTNGVNHAVFSKTENGLQFEKATYHLSGGGLPFSNTQAVFAIADNLNSEVVTNPTTGDLSSSTQKLNLYYFSATPNWSISPGDAGAVDGINSKLNDTGAALTSIDLCFDGGTGKTATITITGLGQLSVRLKVSDLAC